MNGELHTSALMRMLMTCWPSLYPQGRSVVNLYRCYSAIWHHRVCDGVTLTVGQSASFRRVLPLYLYWLKGISGEILLQPFYFYFIFSEKSVFLEVIMACMKLSHFKWVHANTFKDWGGCFRSVFDRHTGSSYRETRVSLIWGQTIMCLWSDYRLWYKRFCKSACCTLR